LQQSIDVCEAMRPLRSSPGGSTDRLTRSAVETASVEKHPFNVRLPSKRH
jgi:hypothetical protein